VREFADNLRWCGDLAFLGCQGPEGLVELGVAVVLARIFGGQKLFGGGKLGGELGAVAAVGAPGSDARATKEAARSLARRA
jgi:hypothetical protein